MMTRLVETFMYNCSLPFSLFRNRKISSQKDEDNFLSFSMSEADYNGAVQTYLRTYLLLQNDANYSTHQEKNITCNLCPLISFIESRLFITNQ